MGNALIVRRGTSLAKRSRALRAAQYVRMSADFQRYSIQNQAAAIAAYAQQNNLTIVRTYVDEGRSGLRIRNRAGLTELIDDVQSGRAEFDHILVYDVSRWGRFQDVDESAHYEFVCKQAGMTVSYCAEQFDNDGSLLSSIIKNIKRVMAAEYSRELSVKVHTGQSRIASLGYRVGGPLTFGLYRELVDEQLRSRGRLTKGERKALKTDRVCVRVGTERERETVRWIFDQFVLSQLSDTEIARRLNAGNVANHNGRPWTAGMINAILKNENYVGNVVYNRTSRRLGQKLTSNPRDAWIRSAEVIEPVVDKGLFARAQRILADRYVVVDEDQMLARLRLLLKRKGRLNATIINDTLGLSSVSSYVKHFGSLRKAYALIGYVPPRDCDWIDNRARWSEVLAIHSAQLSEALRNAGLAIELDEGGATLALKGRRNVALLIARQIPKRDVNHMAQWRAYRKEMPSSWILVLRLDEGNKAIQDYLLLPPANRTGPYLRLSDGALARQEAERFTTFNALGRRLEAQLRVGRRAARDHAVALKPP